jgi:hypothetical protein
MSFPYWILIVGGTAYIDGSAGFPTQFPTLQSCEVQGNKSRSYKAGELHIPESELGLPMQCFHVDDVKATPRCWPNTPCPRQGWQ